MSETLTALFPQGAVEPGDREKLLERSRVFLANRPLVPQGEAFGLRESMESTIEVYRSVLSGKST